MPAITETQEKVIIKEIESRIINQSSANLTSATIKIKINPSESCVEIWYINFAHRPNLIIKNKNSTTIGSNKSGTERFKISWPNQDLLKYYYSTEPFEQPDYTTSSSCAILTSGTDYSIGFIKEEPYVFETKLLQLIENYESFRNEVKNLVGDDFNFGLIYDNGTTIMAFEKNFSTNVYITKVPIRYVDRYANIKSGFIKIMTWE